MLFGLSGHPPLTWDHLEGNCLVSEGESHPNAGHAVQMTCLHSDINKILEASRPPDPELVDLIEQAFLEGQIDGLKAVIWLICGCKA